MSRCTSQSRQTFFLYLTIDETLLMDDSYPRRNILSWFLSSRTIKQRCSIKILIDDCGLLFSRITRFFLFPSTMLNVSSLDYFRRQLLRKYFLVENRVRRFKGKRLLLFPFSKRSSSYQRFLLRRRPRVVSRDSTLRNIFRGSLFAHSARDSDVVR